MYGFLLCLGLPAHAAAAPLARGREATRRLLTSFAEAPRMFGGAFPDERGGWCAFEPAGGAPRRLVGSHAREDGTVLVFGEIYGVQEAAAHTYDVWREHGVEAVRLLEGNFAAVLVDHRTGRAVAVSDTIGQRALRYCEAGDQLILATHDLPIVATGCSPTSIDPVSAASIAIFGWSLQGRSLIQGIRGLDPGSVLTWTRGQVEVDVRPVVGGAGRLEAADRVGRREVLSGMVEQVRRNTEAYCRDASVAKLHLTAGLDSRAALAIALHSGLEGRLVAVTDGEAGVQDVDVAARLSRTYDVPHESANPSPQGYGTFDANLRRLAFAMNGDTSAARAVDQALTVEDAGIVRIYGTGGEIFRGYYYPAAMTPAQLRSLSPDDAARLLWNRYEKKPLPWGDAAVRDGVIERLHEVVGRFDAISSNGADLLDLFYLRERYARWGSMNVQFTWRRQFSPFNSPGAVRDAFRLPAPIGDHGVHKAIVRRYLRSSYLAPINGKDVLPLLGLNGSQRFASRVVARLLRLRQRLGRQAQDGGLDKGAVRSEAFAEYLKEALSDVLIGGDSLARRLFRQEVLASMTTRRAGSGPVPSAGRFATMEQFRSMVQEVGGRPAAEPYSDDFENSLGS